MVDFIEKIALISRSAIEVDKLEGRRVAAVLGYNTAIGDKMEKLITLGACALFVLGVALSIALIVIFISWSFTLGYGIKIKFSAFKKFYAINPDRWEINDDHIVCNTITYSKDKFHFGFIDFIRYQWWLKGHKKRKRMEKENEIMKRVVDSVKRDIEKTEREAKRYQEKARDFMEWHGGGSVG